MKSSVKILLCAALAIAGTAGLHAQPVPKIVVIDFLKAYEGYYETPNQKAKLEEFGNKAKSDADTIIKARADLIAKYQELANKVTGDPTITAVAKADAEKKGADLRAQIQDKEREMQQLSQSSNDIAANQIATYRAMAIPKITAAAKEIAQKKGANMLIDKSNNNNYGTSSFLWLDDGYTDITDEVIKALNVGHPTPTTPASPASPATKPAGESAVPSVSFPLPK
ncbi:MAG: OmpH family outer membrane protein [Verrucomicrobiota bacterium]